MENLTFYVYVRNKTQDKKNGNVKRKLVITGVSALSYPLYCLTTDQLVYRRAAQTTETNTVNGTQHGLRIPTGGRQTSWLFTSAAEGFITRDCRETNP